MPNINNIPTTQYIGPKIVPHLWNPVTWSASTQYDALAVVQYNGNGYVSRFIPPVGTLPTDGDYWVRWSDFNAQVAQLQFTVETFEDRLRDTDADLDSIKAIIPSSSYTSTNTVKKAIDAEATARTAAIDSLKAIIPSSAFSSTNTVKKAIDAEATARATAISNEASARATAISDEASARTSAINALKAIIPASSYSSSNTVKDAIDAKVSTTTYNSGISNLQSQITDEKNIRKASCHNVLDYGAYGDGTHDDTAAIQAAINAASVGDTVLIPRGQSQTYLVNGTINITKNYLTIASETYPNLSWQSSGIYYAPTGSTSMLFNITGSGVTFENLMITTDGGTQPTATKYYCFVTDDYNGADVDLTIVNCWVWNFNRCISSKNRGLKVTNSNFINSRIVIRLSCDDSVTDTSQNYQRGINIQNNRFHNVIRAMYLAGARPYGMIIANNMMDYRGATSETTQNSLLYADNSSYIHSAEIVNNNVLNCMDSAIACNCDVLNSNISNNVFTNRITQAENNILKFSTLQNSVVSGNNLGASKRSCIWVDILRQSIISNNFIANADATGVYCGIEIRTRLYQSVIIANTIFMSIYNSDRYAITYYGTQPISNTVVANNVSQGQNNVFMNKNSASVSSSKIETTIS